jgi:hypothetical protein
MKLLERIYKTSFMVLFVIDIYLLFSLLEVIIWNRITLIFPIFDLYFYLNNDGALVNFLLLVCFLLLSMIVVFIIRHLRQKNMKDFIRDGLKILKLSFFFYCVYIFQFFATPNIFDLNRLIWATQRLFGLNGLR